MDVEVAVLLTNLESANKGRTIDQSQLELWLPTKGREDATDPAQHERCREDDHPNNTLVVIEPLCANSEQLRNILRHLTFELSGGPLGPSAGAIGCTKPLRGVETQSVNS